MVIGLLEMAHWTAPAGAVGSWAPPRGAAVWSKCGAVGKSCLRSSEVWDPLPKDLSIPKKLKKLLKRKSFHAIVESGGFASIDDDSSGKFALFKEGAK